MPPHSLMAGNKDVKKENGLPTEQRILNKIISTKQKKKKKN